MEHAFTCRGCGGPITVRQVRPGEDDTPRWRAKVPPFHEVLEHDAYGLMYFRCRTGDIHAVQIQRPADDEAQPVGDACCSDCGNNDTVDHKTWLEYHDRLVKEYYDVDAEWALIKEICPEVEKARPVPRAPRRIRRARPKRVNGLEVLVLALWYTVAVLDFMIGSYFAGCLFLMAALTLSLYALCRR